MVGVRPDPRRAARQLAVTPAGPGRSHLVCAAEGARPRPSRYFGQPRGGSVAAAAPEGLRDLHRQAGPPRLDERGDSVWRSSRRAEPPDGCRGMEDAARRSRADRDHGALSPFRGLAAAVGQGAPVSCPGPYRAGRSAAENPENGHDRRSRGLGTLRARCVVPGCGPRQPGSDQRGGHARLRGCAGTQALPDGHRAGSGTGRRRADVGFGSRIRAAGGAGARPAGGEPSDALHRGRQDFVGGRCLRRSRCRVDGAARRPGHAQHRGSGVPRSPPGQRRGARGPIPSGLRMAGRTRGPLRRRARGGECADAAGVAEWREDS